MKKIRLEVEKNLGKSFLHFLKGYLEGRGYTKEAEIYSAEGADIFEFQKGGVKISIVSNDLEPAILRLEITGENDIEFLLKDTVEKFVSYIKKEFSIH